MFHVVRRRDQQKGSIATVAFRGDPYHAGISFFQGDLAPGQGPAMHQHPYPETCIVLSGRVAMVVDGEEVVGGTGDVVVIGPTTPHRFTAVGDERLRMVCVHASERFIIDWVNDEGSAGAARPVLAEQ